MCYMHTQIYTWMHTHTHTHTHTRHSHGIIELEKLMALYHGQTSVIVGAYVQKYACRKMPVYVCMYVCVCTYTYTCTNPLCLDKYAPQDVYVCMYVYTHIYTPLMFIICTPQDVCLYV